MQSAQEPEPTVFCEKCKKQIRLSIWDLHDGRCFVYKPPQTQVQQPQVQVQSRQQQQSRNPDQSNQLQDQRQVQKQSDQRIRQQQEQYFNNIQNDPRQQKLFDQNSRQQIPNFYQQQSPYVSGNQNRNRIFEDDYCQEIPSSQINSRGSQRMEKQPQNQQQFELQDLRNRNPYSGNSSSMEIEEPENDSENINCPNCGSQFPISNIENHLKYCLLICEYCQESYPSGQLFDQHLRVCEARKQLINMQQNQPSRRSTTSQQPRRQNTNPNNHIRNQLFNFLPPQFGMLMGLPMDDDSEDLRQVFLQGLIMRVRQMGEDPSNNGGVEKEMLESFPVSNFQKQKNVKEGEEEKCPICLSEFQQNEEIKTLHCTHIFHPECIDPWLEKNSTCPICKKDFNPDNHQSAHDIFFGPRQPMNNRRNPQQNTPATNSQRNNPSNNSQRNSQNQQRQQNF